MRILFLTLLAALMIGCGSNNSSDTSRKEGIIVYISKGNTQCNDDGISPDQSTMTLVGAGIDVMDTFCGAITGLSFPAVCGGGTGEIIAHEIHEVNLANVNELGYEYIETLVDVDNMVSYEIGECTGS
jgi:hypothetical protein